MIEALLILLLLMVFGWLAIAVLGGLFSILGWLLCGLVSLISSLVVVLIAVPVIAVVGLLVLPLIGLALLPFSLPLLIAVLVVWWALRRSGRAVA